MLWFNKDKKKKMEFIQNFVPTSKAQLIQVAMWFHKGDVQKAQEMVDFYMKNMTLPDFDPVAPSFMQQVKTNATSLFEWIKENQGDLVQGYGYIRSIIANKGFIPEAPAEPLPDINK